ncbi:hypothetical protein J7E73_17505 [Paenibacillus albidus]|uniref:stalk domain-containing protein n=1 Tax=Paenibacillus albidus TaxID=2041023 RepID=UPI001BECEDCD|nr:stalk domain-containing protein [Paenibacillus albidus]MBT2290898.1 hypothetical protein [Paenibacillus albidus]
MNKIAAVILSFILLATGSWSLTAGKVSAASGTAGIILNGQALKFDGPVPYRSGSTLMIPLRETAEALRYKTTYQQDKGTIQLVSPQLKVEFKLEVQELTLNGTDKVPFKGSAVFKYDRVYVPLSFFSALGFVTGYDEAANLAQIYSPDVTAGAIAGLLSAGKYQELQERFFSEALKLDAPALQQSWEGIVLPGGNYLGVKTTQSSRSEDQMRIQSVLSFSGAEAELELLLDGSGKLIELRLTPVQQQPKP